MNLPASIQASFGCDVLSDAPRIRLRQLALVPLARSLERLAGVTLPDQLPDVEIARGAELRRARVADMRVVRPDDCLRRPSRPLQMRNEQLERLRHMAVAEVPALDTAPKDGPVVLVRIHDDPGVLLDVELSVDVAPVDKRDP